ncbi:type II CAAX prenyl endopeptidase Rce1 family protein [Burkholderia sp. LMU1-1-1.1]|uniref:CPBP family glutamic-type intramembrane protease n=1 Tax=Burkholderia sp. LMU1-1-1.1 TaxID=3135266 RepID=UPI00342B38AF
MLAARNWIAVSGARLPRHPVARGMSLSLVSVSLASIATGILYLAFPLDVLGSSAAEGLIGKPGWYIFLAAVVLAPLFETVVGQILPIELARRGGASGQVCIFISAALFSLGHLYNGGIANAVATFIGGGVFAYAYVSVRERGVGASYMAAFSAHASHNALLFYAVVPLFS